MLSDEEDLAAILDLPLVQSEREDIMDDRYEVNNDIIVIDMTGDLIIMNEDVPIFNVKGLHTSEKEGEIFAREGLLADKTHRYAGEHACQVRRHAHGCGH